MRKKHVKSNHEVKRGRKCQPSLCPDIALLVLPEQGAGAEIQHKAPSHKKIWVA